MKSSILGFLGVSALCYLILFLTGLCVIIGDATYNESYHRSTCDVKYRYDYVFPVRQVGCWLGEEISQ